MTILFRAVHHFAGGLFDVIILVVHFMFAHILHLDGAESSEPGVQGHFGKADSFDFKTLDELFAKM